MQTVYNDALNERRVKWRASRRSVTYVQQWSQMPSGFCFSAITIVAVATDDCPSVEFIQGRLDLAGIVFIVVLAVAADHADNIAPVSLLSLI